MPGTQFSAMNKLAKAIVRKRKPYHPMKTYGKKARWGKDGNIRPKGRGNLYRASRRKERGERTRVQRNQDFIGQALGRANGNKRRHYL